MGYNSGPVRNAFIPRKGKACREIKEAGIYCFMEQRSKMGS